MAAPLGRDTLPEHWSYGVCGDGRVFFINDKTRGTTWLHPRTGEPVNSGHMIRSGTVVNYAGYHNQRTTTFRHPVTGHISSEHTDFILQDHLKPSGKVHCFGKRDHSIKRNPNVPVVVRGWLYKQDSSGMRLWKRKWFVLSDYCLFYYKDSREETALGSIPLPSYVISPVGPEDHISRKYAFKAEHCGMRTYFFSADTQEDMNGWILAMNQAALMQSHVKREAERSSKSEQQAVPQTNHFSSTHVEVAELRPERDGEECYVYSKEVSEDPVKISSGELEMEGFSQSGAHSRPPSTVPTHRNGLPSSGIPPDQNGNVVYKRGLVPRTDTEKKVQRKTALAQVEHWVKVQKGDPKRSVLCVFRPLYMCCDGGKNVRKPYRVIRMPRSISVPPSPRDIPPPGHPSRSLSPRRPHTPADRVTVRPLDDFATVDTPSLGSPRGICSQISKTSQIERRSMPTMGYITHTVSAPSLHGKTADDTYIKLKKDLEYLDLKVGSSGSVKLSRLCEQDKILQELEARIRTLKEDKDKLESVLDVSHQQMEQYQDQPAHAEKIAYQQKLLREDVVHIRADISQVSTEMENTWAEYSQLERDVDRLRSALQDQKTHSQEKCQLRKELWRIEDVLAGLSSSKANYKVTIDSVRNPERKLVPSASLSAVPSLTASPSMGELKAAQPSPHLSPVQSTQQPLQLSHSAHKPKWPEEDAPPRPPLPHLYSPDEHPPAVPPLPKETSVIRHTSVRGLKRQSDERKRDREFGQYTNGDHKVEIRAFLSEPELLGVGGQIGGLSRGSGYQTLPNRGLTGSSSRLNQSSNISSFVTLRRGLTTTSLKERPKSALERLYSGEPVQQRGCMSAEEQLERMKRHQKALVRERKRTLSQGEWQASSSRASSSSTSRPVSADLGSVLEHKERQRSHSDEWLTLSSTPMRELDLEPLDYQLDLSKELAKPQKVAILERYVDLDPEEPLSPQEIEARHRKVEQIKNILAKSRYWQIIDKPVLPDIDSALQEQERIITMSYALASEASLKSKQVNTVCEGSHL
uniref:Pleckstrin homology domain containing, family A member 7b n=1 Tax=Sinocyclocheilus anshuiensis TaxID=1608454 RepID=A0A671SR56_9TELE